LTPGSPTNRRESHDDRINVIVTGPEEAYDNEAEFWRGNELIAV
jgi:hypothetical protein